MNEEITIGSVVKMCESDPMTVINVKEGAAECAWFEEDRNMYTQWIALENLRVTSKTE